MDPKQMSMKQRLDLWKAKKQQDSTGKRKTVVAFGLTSSEEEKENILKRNKEVFTNTTEQRCADFAKQVSLGRRNTLNINPKQQNVNLCGTAVRVTRRLTLPNQNRKNIPDSQVPTSKIPEKSKLLSDGPLQKRRKTLGAAFDGATIQPAKFSLTSRLGSRTSQHSNLMKQQVASAESKQKNVPTLSTRKTLPVRDTEPFKTNKQKPTIHKSLVKEVIKPITQKPNNKRNTESKTTTTDRPYTNKPASQIKRRTLTVQEVSKKRGCGDMNLPIKRTATVSVVVSDKLRLGTTRFTQNQNKTKPLVSGDQNQKNVGSLSSRKPFTVRGSELVKPGGHQSNNQRKAVKELFKPSIQRASVKTTRFSAENQYKLASTRSNKQRSPTRQRTLTLQGDSKKKGVTNKTNVPSRRTATVSGVTTDRLRGEAKVTQIRKFENIKSRIDTGLKGKGRKTSDHLNKPHQSVQKQNVSRRATFCTGKKATVLPNRRLSAGKLKGRRSSPHMARVRFNTPKSSTKLAESNLSFSTPVTSAVVRDRLGEWLQSKGKTPSRFQNLMCFQDTGKNENTKAGLSVSELDHQQKQLLVEEELCEREARESLPVHQMESECEAPDRVQSLLSECLLLLQSGCPAESVLLWLGEIESSLPTVTTDAKYYVLRSQIAEQQGASDACVIDIFEEAVRNNASPPDEVSNALTEFVERMNKKRTKRVLSPVTDCSPEGATATPRKRQRLDQHNIIPSSTVKYNLAKTTPFFSRLRAKADGQPTPCGIVTPVRRSARLSSTPLPSGVTVLDTLDNLSPQTKSELLFQPNRALQQDFDSAV